MARAELDVLSIGNAIVDVLAHVDDGFVSGLGQDPGTMRAVGEGEAARLHDLLPGAEVTPGGSTANTAVGAAMLGARAAFVGKVRDDATGALFARGLRDAGVAYAVPPAPSGPATARCIVLVTPDGERSMNTFIGACSGLGPDDVDETLVASASHLMVEGYLWDVPRCREACERAIRAARAAGRKVALTLSDPGCAERNRDGFMGMVSGGAIDLLFANRKEAMALLGSDETASVGALSRLPVTGVVTMSGRGVELTHGGRAWTRPAHPVDAVVDTTGAGDMFAAGFLAGLSRGSDLDGAAALAAFSAAQVIRRLGARPPPDVLGLAREAGLA